MQRSEARGRRRWAAALGLTVVLLFPMRTEVVPAWTVRVVDPSGAPVAGAVVRQQWKYEPFDAERHEGSDMTRKPGTVSFPRRTLRMSLAERAVGLVAGLVRSDPHADWGRSSLLVATAPGCDAGEAAYRPGRPLPAEIRLRRATGVP